MTTERAKQEWEYFERTVLPAYIDRLNNLEEQKTDLDLKKKDIIQEIADRIESAGWVPSDSISAYLKKVLKGVVADRTIEDALGKKHKRKHESLPRVSKPQSAVQERERSQSVLPKKEIEVSSTGYSTLEEPQEPGEEPEPADDEETPFELYEGEPDTPVVDVDPDSNLYEWEKQKIPDSVKEEIAMFEKEREELQIRLQEALKLLDQERIRYANLEVELGEAQTRPGKQNKDVDANEELQIKYDELKQAYNELLEVERLRTSKSDFQSAAKLPHRAWIVAIDAINFFRELNKASRYAIENNDPWKKIIFEIKADGQLKQARLEE